jgi:hypothetical protein
VVEVVGVEEMARRRRLKEILPPAADRDEIDRGHLIESATTRVLVGREWRLGGGRERRQPGTAAGAGDGCVGGG